MIVQRSGGDVLRCPWCFEPAPWFDWRAWRARPESPSWLSFERWLVRCPECKGLARHRRLGSALFTAGSVMLFALVARLDFVHETGVVSTTLMAGASAGGAAILGQLLFDRLLPVGRRPKGTAEVPPDEGT